jgi:hypothetical protein
VSASPGIREREELLRRAGERQDERKAERRQKTAARKAERASERDREPRIPLQRGEGPRARRCRASISPATPAQRERVKDRACIVCAAHPCDPAHLIDRSLAPGGGDATVMVVPLCRSCHRDYDEGSLDLLSYLEPHWRDAVAVAVEEIGLLRTLKRITKSTWIAVPSEETA